MSHGYVVAESAVPEAKADGDTAATKVTIGAAEGCERLEQRVVRFVLGRSLERGDALRDEILFVVSGSGSLVLDGAVHELAPDMGVYIRMGERYVVDNPGPGALELVSVLAPGTNGPRTNRQVTVRFAEQPELRADAKRTFRYLVNQDAGCLDLTQFVGIVEPCRAPDHSHTYDELGYIVEGRGLAHFKDGRTVELGPGSCFHLPPEQVHCIENVGPGVMRIMGVFHPSGDPASRAYDEATQSQEEA